VLANRLAAVAQFGEVEDVLGVVGFPDDRDAAGGGAGVELEADRLQGGGPGGAVDQPDGEGVETVDPGPALGQQLAGAGGMAGHQRFLVFVEDEHAGLDLFCRHGACVRAGYPAH
jgi:hypothetical protein